MSKRKLLVVVLALFGLGGSLLSPGSARAVTLDPSLCAPVINRFTLRIDNPYFPLQEEQRSVLQGEEDGELIGLRITVLEKTAAFYGGTIRTRVVEELEWVDENGNGRVNGREELIEVSRNYFAQTSGGTVCYFGEDVDIYEGGVLVSHQGSWRADAPGNAPGIFMPADPKPGMEFAQEIAPGIAEDRATIVGFETVTVPAGTFPNALHVTDVNPLDGSTSDKYYGRGVGLVLDDPLELVRFRQDSD
jgi:hypothetical protein